MPGFFKPYRAYFACAGAFSLVINLLLLVPALYMLQVFDRVLTSRHVETLVLLTVFTLAALFVMMLLDALRARVLAAAALAMDRGLGAPVLRRLLSDARQPNAQAHVNGLKDLATLRAFFTGPAVLALFDAPWLQLYLLALRRWWCWR
jgi:ABC-type protease/lipase transport system fused ATPase/permease subunit